MGVFENKKMTYSNTIGVMDSGVGGLSILKELTKALPNADFAYFGDTKNLPYGTKSHEEILSFNRKILNFFLSNGIKTVVIACNTTSALTFEDLEKEFSKKGVRIFPLIQTVAKPLCEGLSDGDCICVLSTVATQKSGKYKEEILKVNPNLKVVQIGCNGFVEIVEERKYDKKESLDLIEEKMKLVLENKAKRVILGCTHYPYLIDMLSKFAPKELFKNPAIYLAKNVKDSINPIGSGKLSFFVTKNPLEFKKSAKLFFEINEDVKLVEL